jgi:hypothetical protein
MVNIFNNGNNYQHPEARKLSRQLKATKSLLDKLMRRTFQVEENHKKYMKQRDDKMVFYQMQIQDMTQKIKEIEGVK